MAGYLGEKVITEIALNPIPGGGGKFAYPLGDSFFRTEERFPKTPFFVTFNNYLFRVFPEDFSSIPPLDQKIRSSG